MRFLYLFILFFLPLLVSGQANFALYGGAGYRLGAEQSNTNYIYVTGIDGASTEEVEMENSLGVDAGPVYHLGFSMVYKYKRRKLGFGANTQISYTQLKIYFTNVSIGSQSYVAAFSNIYQSSMFIASVNPQFIYLFRKFNLGLGPNLNWNFGYDDYEPPTNTLQDFNPDLSPERIVAGVGLTIDYNINSLFKTKLMLDQALSPISKIEAGDEFTLVNRPTTVAIALGINLN